MLQLYQCELLNIKFVSFYFSLYTERKRKQTEFFFLHIEFKTNRNETSVC